MVENSAPRNQRGVLVFVLRHGEREDEVVGDQSYQKLSLAQRLDPALTATGHDQARQAWEQLSDGISSASPRLKRIAIFASPLKRAIGTAIMVSDVISANTSWEAVPPSLTAVKSEQSALSAAIPIVVSNGLCDCAAQVASLGGHRNAIRTNLLSFAATDNVTPDNFPTSQMDSAWQVMTKRARNTATTISPKSFQLWNIDNGQGALLPMTPPLSIDGTVAKMDSVDCYTGKGGKLLVKIPSRNLKPVDQVVRMAMDAACDACIIISHREELRELYRIRCGYQFNRKKLGYCCIGGFEVKSGGDDDSSPLEWRLHDVTPYQEFTSKSVQSMIELSFTGSPPPDDSDHCQLEWFIAVPIHLKVSHPVLVVKITRLPSEERTFFVEKLVINRTTDYVGRVRDSVDLEIISGGLDWTNLLLSLKNKSATGTLGLRSTESSIQVQHAILLNPMSQPLLPCPPCFIRLELL